jgi:hypothetical protein
MRYVNRRLVVLVCTCGLTIGAASAALGVNIPGGAGGYSRKCDSVSHVIVRTERSRLSIPNPPPGTRLYFHSHGPAFKVSTREHRATVISYGDKGFHARVEC